MQLRNKKFIGGLMMVMVVFGLSLLFINPIPVQSEETLQRQPPPIPATLSDDSTNPTETTYNKGTLANDIANTPKTPDDYSLLGSAMGWIIYYLAASLGFILTKVVDLMIFVASFNDMKQEAVTIGWKAIRDLCNNFFIIILMVIAVGTILRIESYRYNKLLSKLLLMAVLINFSMMFTFIMIDFSQVITLSFASKINAQEGKNILLGAINLPSGVVMNGATDMEQIDADSKQAIMDDAAYSSSLAVIAALIILVVVAVVSIVVVLIITIILAYRIVAFWFLIILSPLAFFSSTFPRGQEYWSRWWKELSKYLIVGPVMLFFLYISFLVMVQLGNSSTPSTLKGAEADKLSSEKDAGFKNETKLSQLATKRGLFNVVITLGLLVGTLIMAQETGAAGGKWAGKGMNGLKKMGKGAALKFTGAGLAADVGKQYWKNRQEVKKGARQATVDKFASGIATGVSKVKGLAVAPLNKTWDKVTGKKNLDQVRKELVEQEEKMGDEKIKAVKEKKDFKDSAGNLYKRDATTGKWSARDAAGTVMRASIDDKQLQRMITSGRLEDLGTARPGSGKKIEDDSFEYTKNASGGWERIDKANRAAGSTAITEEQLTRDLGGIDEDDVKKKEEEKNRAERRKKRIQRGGIALGAAAGALFGTVGVAPLLTTILTSAGLAGAGAVAAHAAGKKIANAGKDDLKAFGKYRGQKVSDARDKAKQMDNTEVLASMDDESKDKFTRAAMSMEAMSRGLLSLEKAQTKKDELEKQFKAKGDNLLTSQLKQLMEKNYVGGTQLFQDAKIDTSNLDKYKKISDPVKQREARLADARKKAAAQRQIKSGFEDGSYKIKDLDSGTLGAATSSAAAGLSTASFLSQYKDKDVSDSKRAIIRQALERDGSQSSRQKLAHLSGIAGVWKKMKPGSVGHDPAELAQAQEFMKTLSLEDIEGLMKKKPDGLKEAVAPAPGSGGAYNLSADVKLSLNSDPNNPINKSIRQALGITATTIT